MLSEKRWRPDAVLFLASALLLSMFVGSALKLWIDQHVTRQSPDIQSFYAFIIGTLSFQGAGLILLHFFLKFHQITWKEFFGLRSENWKRVLKLAVLTAVVAIPLTMLLKEACALLINYFSGPPAEQVAIQVLSKTLGWGQRISFALAALVLAPIVEEALFRGVLYPAVKQYAGPMIALAGTSLLFAGIHSNLVSFLPLTVLSMFLVWLYEKTDALVAPIITHALSNAVNFSLFLIQGPK